MCSILAQAHLLSAKTVKMAGDEAIDVAQEAKHQPGCLCEILMVKKGSGTTV